MTFNVLIKSIENDSVLEEKYCNRVELEAILDIIPYDRYIAVRRVWQPQDINNLPLTILPNKQGIEEEALLTYDEGRPFIFFTTIEDGKKIAHKSYATLTHYDKIQFSFWYNNEKIKTKFFDFTD